MKTEIVINNTVLGVWQGLGGAITEATAYNYAKLSPDKKRRLIEVYYGKSGLGYCWGRLSIGSNDFCLKPYEYSRKTDLTDFSIEHDEKWVIPMLRDILKKKEVCFVASPWSPPKYMKLRLDRYNFSVLKPWCYEAFASYLRMWLEAYRKHGVKINYITLQNEPRARQIWESCVYSYGAQRKMAYKYLADALKDSDTQILLWDHNKSKLSKVADKLFSGKYVTKYGCNDKVAGLCFHWYDGVFPGEMWEVRQKYPEILMLSSEMSCGFSPYDKEAWKNDAKLYCRELFADVNAGVSVFIDWNMLLDFQGGPSYCKNYLKSPVILNEKGDDFILTPIYAVLKKFAELFPVGSKVVRLEYASDNIVAVGRKVGAHYEVAIANVSLKEQEIEIRLGDKVKRSVIKESEITSIKI